MNIFLVGELQKHKIFYVKSVNGETSFVFYISVPKNVQKTNIAIDLKYDTNAYDYNNTDSEVVKNNILECYKAMDNCSSSIVIPMLTSEQKNLFSIQSEQNFLAFEQIIGSYINEAYTFLVQNGLKQETIAQTIYLIDETKANQFNQYFSNKHKNDGRIEIKTVLALLQDNNTTNNVVTPQMPLPVNPVNNTSNTNTNSGNIIAPTNDIQGETPDMDEKYKTIDVNGVKFVVGLRDDDKKNESVTPTPALKRVLTPPPQQPIPPSNINVGEKLDNGGFVSYLATFIISALAVFLILYIIIK